MFLIRVQPSGQPAEHLMERGPVLADRIAELTSMALAAPRRHFISCCRV